MGLTEIKDLGELKRLTLSGLEQVSMAITGVADKNSSLGRCPGAYIDLLITKEQEERASHFTVSVSGPDPDFSEVTAYAITLYGPKDPIPDISG